jgi:hypothetical protein
VTDSTPTASLDKAAERYYTELPPHSICAAIDTLREQVVELASRSTLVTSQLRDAFGEIRDAVAEIRAASMLLASRPKDGETHV